MSIRSRRHLVIPDAQVRPGVPLDHLTWIGNYIAEKRPDVLINLGDWADMASLSSYDTGKKCFEGRRYKQDIECAKDAMSMLLAPLRKRKVKLPRMVLTLGNHEERILRAVEGDPKLDGTIGLTDLGYEKAGWEVHEFLRPVIVDGICYCHYFVSGVMGRPVTSAAALLTKKHMSCVQGHLQQRQIAYAVRADGRQLTAIFAGACAQHDEDYLGPQGNQFWRGIWLLQEIDHGSFDEMPVSLNYLRRKYS